MCGYISNIEQETLENENFRRVIYTAKNSQLVLMSLAPGEDIGMEVHELDQFIRVESGKGVAVLDGVESPVEDGTAVVVPAGTEHNVINTSETEALKIYTIYSPPDHKDGTIHQTKAAATMDANDHFDGRTSIDN